MNKYVAISNLSMYYTWKNIRKSYQNKKFKISVQLGMENLKYHMDNIHTRWIIFIASSVNSLQCCQQLLSRRCKSIKCICS